jgi:hypothetical protein
VAVTQLILEQQVRLSKPAAPGSFIGVAADGVSLGIVAVGPVTSVVYGSPTNPGCVAEEQVDGKFSGTYRFAAAKIESAAVFRNGVRLSRVGEYTLDITTGTLKIPGAAITDPVLCDYVIKFPAEDVDVAR